MNVSLSMSNSRTSYDGATTEKSKQIALSNDTLLLAALEPTGTIKTILTRSVYLAIRDKKVVDSLYSTRIHHMFLIKQFASYVDHNY